MIFTEASGLAGRPTGVRWGKRGLNVGPIPSRAWYAMLLPSIALHCLALPCIALPCIALHCLALPCIALLPRPFAYSLGSSLATPCAFKLWPVSGLRWGARDLQPPPFNPSQIALGAVGINARLQLQVEATRQKLRAADRQVAAGFALVAVAAQDVAMSSKQAADIGLRVATALLGLPKEISWHRVPRLILWDGAFGVVCLAC